MPCTARRQGTFPRGHVAALKEKLSVGGPVTFIDIVPDSLIAYIRFETRAAVPTSRQLNPRFLADMSNRHYNHLCTHVTTMSPPT